MTTSNSARRGRSSSVSAARTLAAPRTPVPRTPALRSTTSMPAPRMAAIAFTLRGWSRSYVPKYRAFTAADYREPRVTDLISYRDALGLVLARAQPLPAEDVQPPALGRVLAESAVAAVDLPPFPSSAMDGFAVRPADTPGRLGVVGESIAG